MDIDKLRQLTDQELATELATQRRQLYDLRFQLATRQLTDYKQLPHTRRTIARVLTVMSERSLGIARMVATAPAKRATASATRSAKAASAKTAAPARARRTRKTSAEPAAEETTK
jgi:large subunit ribosomal protein L29